MYPKCHSNLTTNKITTFSSKHQIILHFSVKLVKFSIYFNKKRKLHTIKPHEVLLHHQRGKSDFFPQHLIYNKKWRSIKTSPFLLLLPRFRLLD